MRVARALGLLWFSEFSETSELSENSEVAILPKDNIFLNYKF